MLQETDPNPPGFESWNPGGSAFFRFLDCRVTGAVGPDGNPLGSGSTDPVLGSAVETPQKPQTRVAKIVDLDPDQQLIMLVGVVVTLTLAGGKGSVTGLFAAACATSGSSGPSAAAETGPPVAESGSRSSPTSSGWTGRFSTLEAVVRRQPRSSLDQVPSKARTECQA